MVDRDLGIIKMWIVVKVLNVLIRWCKIFRMNSSFSVLFVFRNTKTLLTRYIICLCVSLVFIWELYTWDMHTSREQGFSSALVTAVTVTWKSSWPIVGTQFFWVNEANWDKKWLLQTTTSWRMIRSSAYGEKIRRHNQRLHTLEFVENGVMGAKGGKSFFGIFGGRECWYFCICPNLLKYKRCITLCKFRLYSVMIWYI